MAGAKHIAAHVRLKAVLPDPQTVEQDPSSKSPGDEPVPPADHAALVQAFNDAPEIITLEYMRHGDLSHFLKKVGDRNLKLKSEELWRIFHCCKLVTLL